MEPCGELWLLKGDEGLYKLKWQAVVLMNLQNISDIA